MYKGAVITVSDKGSKGEREDVSGKVISDLLLENGFEIAFKTIVPDELELIQEALKTAISSNANLILTTGGTGFSKRDVTPEATKKVIERDANGVAEAIRANSFKYTDRAMLSRGVAGICGDSLIINLPGSPKAVSESLEFVLNAVMHGLDILTDKEHDCARK